MVYGSIFHTTVINFYRNMVQFGHRRGVKSYMTGLMYVTQLWHVRGARASYGQGLWHKIIALDGAPCHGIPVV